MANEFVAKNGLISQNNSTVSGSLTITQTLQQGSGSIAFGTFSHAQGRQSIASGSYSHAEGRQTIASGSYSHAEGFGTQARGDYSHAEGYLTTTIGLLSHAEGYSTTARGDYSHTEGDSTQANGIFSHAEGSSTIASGSYSHAEGASSLAQGDYSHAEGSSQAYGLASHAEGGPSQELGSTGVNVYLLNAFQYDEYSGGVVRSSVNSIVVSGDYSTNIAPITCSVFGISDPSTGITLLPNNGFYAMPIIDSITYDGIADETSFNFAPPLEAVYKTVLNYTTTAYGNYSHAEGVGTFTTITATGSHAEGFVTATEGKYSHAEGYHTLANGDYSHAEGYYTKAYGLGSHAEGSNWDINLTISASIVAITDFTYDEYSGGETIVFSSPNQIVITNDYSYLTQPFNTTFFTVTAGGNAVLLNPNYYTLPTITNITFDGTYTTFSFNPYLEPYYYNIAGGIGQATGSYSHVEGMSTVASGAYSHAEGYLTLASGKASHAEGLFTTASGPYSHAEGYYTEAIGFYTHAEGYGTDAIGERSHAEGDLTYAVGGAAHTEGAQTIAYAYASHTEGNNTRTYADFAHAEGVETNAYGTASHTEGLRTITLGNYSHAEGRETTAKADYQHVQGTFNMTSSVTGAFIVGNGVSDGNRKNLIHAGGSVVEITGSLNVSAGITGSLFGTASYALTSAGGGSTFPYTGSAIISGSLIVTGSLVVSGSSTFTNIGPAIFNGDTTITGSLITSGSTSLIGTTTLNGSQTITGSGNLTIKSSGATALTITTTDFGGGGGTNLFLNLGATTGNTYANIGSRISGGSGGGTLVLNSAGGNVGIGKTTANAVLDVNGNTIITGSLTTTGNVNGATPTELGYLSGVTSNIQTQLNNLGDVSIEAYQKLGSQIKAQTVGLTILNLTLNSVTVQGNAAGSALRLIPVYLQTPQTIQGVMWFQNAVGVYTPNNENRVGLYSYSGGTATLRASSANDGTMWSGSYTTAGTYTSKSFSTPYAADADLYYIAMLMSFAGSTTAPTFFAGPNLVSSAVAARSADFTNGAILYAARTTVAALPSTITVSTYNTVTQNIIWAAVY